MWRALALVPTVVVASLLGCAAYMAPEIGANGLLRPARHRQIGPAPAGCETASFAGAGVTLAGWQCRTPVARRATIVYLHGIADNRGSARGVVARYLPLGYDVIAYDSRAHGDSTGEFCTYGYYEQEDLRRVIDSIDGGPVLVIGTSLGAAVALQEAADDHRVRAVVAAETFSDLRTVARERASRLMTEGMIRRAFALAEDMARFDVDAASPVTAGPRIRADVLLIHGAADRDTPPDHSRRVFNALVGRKRLLLVPGAHHNQSLTSDVWRQVDSWIADSLSRRRPSGHVAEPTQRLASPSRSATSR